MVVPRAISGLFAVLILMSLTSTAEARRVALVIGNDTYESATPLDNPTNDARAIAETFRGLGFSVILGTNLDLKDSARMLAEFEAELRGAEVGAFYYAGHAIQLEGENFLIPTDATLENKFLFSAESIALRDITEIMASHSEVSLVFLDACRNNPFLDRVRAALPKSRAANLTRGLARVKMANNESMIMFATAANDVAADGNGDHSPFAQALLTHLPAPDTEISVAMKRVTRDVREATNGKQSPELQQSMTVEMYLNLSATIGGRIQSREPIPERSKMSPTEARNRLEQLWQSARLAANTGDEETYLDYVDQALKLASSYFGEDSEEYGRANNHLIGALTNHGRIEDAAYAAREAIRVFTALRGPNSIEVAGDRGNLASRLRRLKRYDEAEAEYLKSIEIFENSRLSGWDYISFASVLSGYAQFLVGEVGREQEALDLSRRAVAQIDLSGRTNEIHFGWTLANAGYIERQVGDCVAAKNLFERAVGAFRDAGVADRQRDLADAIRMAATPCAAAMSSGLPTEETSRAREDAVFDAAKEVGTPRAWAYYFDEFPRGAHRDDALETEMSLFRANLQARGTGRNQSATSARSIEWMRREAVAYFALSRAEQLVIQTTLTKKGYPTGAIDGALGPRSFEALAEFQQDRRLYGDGVIDRATLRELGIKPKNNLSTSWFPTAATLGVRYDSEAIRLVEPDTRVHRLIEEYRGNVLSYRLFDGHVYAVIRTQGWAEPWTQIERKARAAGGYLAAIESPAEEAAIVELFRFDSVFWSVRKERDTYDFLGNDDVDIIGPSFGLLQSSNGSWAWANNSAANYRNWMPGYPDNSRPKTYGEFVHKGLAPNSLPSNWRWGNWHATRGSILIEIE